MNGLNGWMARLHGGRCAVAEGRPPVAGRLAACGRVARSALVLAVLAVGGLALIAPSLARAVTVNEADYGEFSGDYRAPTAVALDWDGGLVLTGALLSKVATGKKRTTRDWDFLAFTGLPTGSQLLTFTLSGADSYDGSGNFYAGANIFMAQTPFPYEWYTAEIYREVRFDYSVWAGPSETNTLTRDVDITLGDDFAGTLYLAMNTGWGSDLTYSVALGSSTSEIPAVPLPSSALMLLAGLGVLALMARRSSRSRALPQPA